MRWRHDEFGASHEGRAAAVLADGSEPGPRYFGMGSSIHMSKSVDWWVYDGQFNAPKATHLRGACSCGWRGTAIHSIDWSDIDPDYAPAYDTEGPLGDWEDHVKEIEERADPLPGEVLELVEQLEKRINSLADEAPLAALRAVFALERAAQSCGERAASYVRADRLPEEKVAQGLGLPQREATTRVLRYRHWH